MKRYLVYISLIITLVIAFNVYLFFVIYNHQVNYQKNILLEQAKNSAIEVESTINEFNNNINKILFTDDFANLFNDNEIKQSTLRKLEVFYSAYENMIKNILIYDQNKNGLNLSMNDKNEFITDDYLAQRQPKLEPKETMSVKDGTYLYYLPVFADNKVVANVVITMDFERYLFSVLNNYLLDEVLWQWIINEKGILLSANIKADVEGEIPEVITRGLLNSEKVFVAHYMKINGGREKLLSACYPVSMLNQDFGIVFSLNNSVIYKEIIRFILIGGIISMVVLFASMFLLLRVIFKKYHAGNLVNKDLEQLKSVIDNLPIGVIILDSQRKIKAINKTAKNLLFIKADEDLTGKNISDRFLLAKSYTQDDESDTAYDSNQFILYQREGNEVVVYKKETAFIHKGEDIFLEAFIDVTAIEKSRKYEAAANTAKSEFLAKMSHEIRTPMNGIIGMTEALNQENLTTEQKEYIQILKKSADLLLNIIDDILDFSKIEAGKMQLEEIPYKLREEVKISLDLFRPIIEDKEVELTVDIDPEVPDNVIGDPFRLRQVLSNLVSNAVKFTHEGKIAVSVHLEEEYNGNITLRFTIEDTGVGIPKQKLESIFNSFAQAEESTSRKYGGSGLGTTISKQLVTLMNGEIWVESPSSISTNHAYPGTKFSFTIEVFSNEKLDKDFDFSEITDLSKVNVLIISQNGADKKRLIKLLDHHGISHSVYKFQNDKKDNLNDLLKRNEQDYHVLVLLDEPNFNSIEIARSLMESKIINNFLVFMVSSSHKPDNYIQSKRSGIDYYMTQPFEQDEFLDYLLENYPNIIKIVDEDQRVLREDLSILVAEDNTINQKVAETIFGFLGYKIDIAVDGNEAVSMVKEKNYDIVFMDLLMPDKDGIQATIDIRGLGRQIPIVAMTASASKKGRNKAITSGMNDYIVKPVKSETIKKILIKWFS
ncbi:MAG: response regulator [Bacteroidales bacterium]|nr:response regulator [Bacteroidales bacterium]